jgi:hypothetical protein
MIIVPNANDNSACPRAVFRIRVEVRLVSELAKLMPTAKET